MIFSVISFIFVVFNISINEMDNLNNEQPPLTLKDIIESFREIGRLFKESSARLDKEMKESREEFDQRKKEQDEHLKALREEFYQEMKASSEVFDQRMEESRKEFDRKFGSWGNNFGAFAEEYFFNSFDKGQKNFFGEDFYEIRKKIKGIEKDDEYDILLINGQSIGIVEVKFKAHENDITKVLKKADTFRINFPKYKNHRVYLGLATMAFYPELEQECEKQGIAIVKQVGDSVVINDKHLKVF